MKEPKNWPHKQIYSPESQSVDLHMDLLRLALFSTCAKDLQIITPCIEEKRVYPHVEIRKITPQLIYKGPNPHPLVGCKDSRGLDEYGLFAKRKIPQNTDLGEYVGKLRLMNNDCAIQEPKNFNSWEIYYDKKPYLYIDAQEIANEMVFVNDYRGLSEAPNVQVKWMINRGFYYFGYATSREIDANEELLVHYGKR